MSARIARWRAVPDELLDDHPALASLVDSLADEVRAEAKSKGALVYNLEARLTGSVPTTVEIPRTRLERLLRRKPRTMQVGPKCVLVEAVLVPITVEHMPLHVQHVAQWGDTALATAVLPHASCADGVLDGTVDVGGYREIRCPVHGACWRRGERGAGVDPLDA